LPVRAQKNPSNLGGSRGVKMRLFMSSKIGKKDIPLDTLGQLPTDALKSLKKRARSKWYTTAIVGRLLFLNSPLHSYYQRAYYCSHILTQNGKKITTKYCDTRVCHICNRIRTAKLMNGYVSQLSKFEKLEFVTLTIPNCTEAELPVTIDLMLKNFSNIVRVLRERRKIDLSGIRKFEVTYNAVTNTYHPHIHALVDSGVGNIIVTEWLNRYVTAFDKAQDVVEADLSALNEIFKYTTKIVAGRSKNKIQVFIPALDVIMQSLKGRRCFQPFGKVKKVDENLDDLDAVEYDIPEYDFLEWIWNDCDWVNSGKTLTGYVSPDIDFDFIE
jgi:ribosomal protein S8